jgi:hypothetical protein
MFRLYSARGPNLTEDAHQQPSTTSRSSPRSPLHALLNGKRVRQLHDLRGRLGDPANDHRPSGHRARPSVALNCANTEIPVSRSRAQAASQQIADGLFAGETSQRYAPAHCHPGRSPQRLPTSLNWADLAQDIDNWHRLDVRADDLPDPPFVRLGLGNSGGCGSTERAVFQVQGPRPAIVGSVRAGPRRSRNWPAGQLWPVAPHGVAPYRPG